MTEEIKTVGVPLGSKHETWLDIFCTKDPVSISKALVFSGLVTKGHSSVMPTKLFSGNLTLPSHHRIANNVEHDIIMLK